MISYVGSHLTLLYDMLTPSTLSFLLYISNPPNTPCWLPFFYINSGEIPHFSAMLLDVLPFERQKIQSPRLS